MEPPWRYAHLSASVVRVSLDILDEITARIFQSIIDVLSPHLPATQSPYHSFIALKPQWLPLSTFGLK